MELPIIVHELRTLNEEYKKRLTDKEPATAVYCKGFCTILQKFLEKHNGSYEEYVFSLCIFLCHFAASYGELAIDNAKEKICQQLFRLCIKAVLDVKWKELSDENTCRQKFRETVDAVHTQLERFDFFQFHLIRSLMETHWDHPTLSRIMAGADDLEEQEVMEYFTEEDPTVLKVRVEILLDENCEEFALNLCKWCCLHPALVDNVEIRETQLFMLYRTGNVDKIQEECAKISSDMAVQIIKNLQECEAQQSFCVMIAQTFLVQNWVRGLSADSGTKILLKLWIRLQYLVDGDLDKFSDSIWAIAKLSQHTEQITFLVEALREEAGDTFLQLNTNLCIYAFNLDKGCLEQAVADKDMELILCRNVALSKTSQTLMKLYLEQCPKLAKLSAVTSFALDPSEENFDIVYTVYNSVCHEPSSSSSLSPSNSTKSHHEDNLIDSNSPNKFVNRLTNMLDGLHVSPTKESKRLRAKNKVERNRHSMSHRTVDNVEYCGLSVNPATLYEVDRLLNNICPFYLDTDLSFTDLRNICMEHLTRHQEMLMVLHEESTDEYSDYSSYEDEQAERADISAEVADLADNGTGALSSEGDNGGQKLDDCVAADCHQEVSDSTCACGPSLDAIGQKSCQPLFETNSMKCDATKTPCHLNEVCPNNVSSRNLFEAFNRDLSSKACSTQQEQHQSMADATKTPNTVDKEVSHCGSECEKSPRFSSCGAPPAGNCKCDNSLCVPSCLSFDGQLKLVNTMDNSATSTSHNLHSMEKSASNPPSKMPKMKIKDEHCCCSSSSSGSSSLPNSITNCNSVHDPSGLKCVCKMKSKSIKKSDKSLKCDKKHPLQIAETVNCKESQLKPPPSSNAVTEDSADTNDRLLEKLRSCIAAQAGSEPQDVNETFTLSKTEKTYIDRYCQFLKTVRQFEMALLAQKNGKTANRHRRSYLVVYRCGICCEFFDQVSDLKDHVQSICKASLLDIKNLAETSSIFCTKDSVLSKIKFFKCLKCLQYTCTRREMDDHLRLCGIPLANKTSKNSDVTTPVQKLELHKPSLVTSGSPVASTDSLHLSNNNNNNNNNNNVCFIKTERESISEVSSSANNSSHRHVADIGGMSADASKKIDTLPTEMHSQLKYPEDNIARSKIISEEYFKCQMCGRLLLGPHRHRLHLEACKKRCEWKKDRRLKRMSLAKPSEKVRPVVIKKEPDAMPTMTSAISTKAVPPAAAISASAEMPTGQPNKKMSASPSNENLSLNSPHPNVGDVKPEFKPKPLMPQPEKPKHCPDCERIIKLRKVSQQLGITEKMLIKTEPQEIPNPQPSPVLPAISKTTCNSEGYSATTEPNMTATVVEGETAVAPTAATVNIPAEVPKFYAEANNIKLESDNMNTDECIKRTMLQIKSEMENKQLMQEKVELHNRRISNVISNLVPTTTTLPPSIIPLQPQPITASISIPPPITATTSNSDISSKNKFTINTGRYVPKPAPNFELVKSKVEPVVEGLVRKRSVGTASPYCRKCDFHFRNRSNFVKHLAITHLQPYTKEYDPNPDSNTVIFHCNFCQGEFEIWFKYINHIPNHSALILDKLNCKMVEETYSQEIKNFSPPGISPGSPQNELNRTNRGKNILKKTYLRLVWPSPDEDITSVCKRKRRRGTHKSRRTNRHSVPHPNPSLGNLSKMTIMNFTQASGDTDENTKKEVLEVMNDLLQKIVGTNDQGQNIMDVGSMPKSVTEKRKTVPLPVRKIISSNCPRPVPINNNNTASGSVIHTCLPPATIQSCVKKLAPHTSTLVPDKTLRTPQKCEIGTVDPLHKMKTVSEGAKIPKIGVAPPQHGSRVQSCVRPLNPPQKTENVCSFKNVNTSLKVTCSGSCSKNVPFQNKDKLVNCVMHLPSPNKAKSSCSNLKKVSNVNTDNSLDQNKGKISTTPQSAEAVKKNNSNETTPKLNQEKLSPTCFHSNVCQPSLCKPSLSHSSSASPSSVIITTTATPSSNTFFSTSPLIPTTSISKNTTIKTPVSLPVSVTALPPISTISKPQSLQSMEPKSVSKVMSLSTSTGTFSSNTAAASTSAHDSKSVPTTSIVSSSRSHPISPVVPSSSSPNKTQVPSSAPKCTFTKSLPSITSLVSLQSPALAKTPRSPASSRLPLCPTSTHVVSVVTPTVTNASNPPCSICTSAATDVSSKPLTTSTTICSSIQTSSSSSSLKPVVITATSFSMAKTSEPAASATTSSLPAVDIATSTLTTLSTAKTSESAASATTSSSLPAVDIAAPTSTTLSTAKTSASAASATTSSSLTAVDLAVPISTTSAFSFKIPTLSTAKTSLEPTARATTSSSIAAVDLPASPSPSHLSTISASSFKAPTLSTSKTSESAASATTSSSLTAVDLAASTSTTLSTSKTSESAASATTSSSLTAVDLAASTSTTLSTSKTSESAASATTSSSLTAVDLAASTSTTLSTAKTSESAASATTSSSLTAVDLAASTSTTISTAKTSESAASATTSSSLTAVDLAASTSTTLSTAKTSESTASATTSSSPAVVDLAVPTSFKAPTLSTSSSLQSDNTLLASSSSSLAPQSTGDKVEAPSSKLVTSEADDSQSLKYETSPATMNTLTETTQVLSLSATNTDNDLKSSSSPKPNSGLSPVSKESDSSSKTATSTITTATTTKAGDFSSSQTVTTACSVMQSNTGPISLHSSTVPKIVPTPPLDTTTTTVEYTKELCRESNDIPLSDVPNSAVQLPQAVISDVPSDNCSTNNLALPSAIESNSTTIVSTSLSSVVERSSPNLFPNTTFSKTIPKASPLNANVPLSSTSASTLSNNNNHPADSLLNVATSFQPSTVSLPTMTSASTDPLSTVSTSFISPVGNLDVPLNETSQTKPNQISPVSFTAPVTTISATASNSVASEPALKIFTDKVCVASVTSSIASSLESKAIISTASSVGCPVSASNVSSIPTPCSTASMHTLATLATTSSVSVTSESITSASVSKPSTTSTESTLSVLKTVASTEADTVLSDTDTSSISTVKSDSDTTLAFTSSVTSKSITATSPSKPSTISVKPNLTVSKTVVSTEEGIVFLDSASPSVLTAELDPETKLANTSSHTSESLTQAPPSKPSTISAEPTLSVLKSVVPTEVDIEPSNSNPPSLSTVESDPDTTLETMSSVTSESVTATSPSKPLTISVQPNSTLSKTLVSTEVDILPLNSDSLSVSTVEPDSDTTLASSSSIVTKSVIEASPSKPSTTSAQPNSPVVSTNADILPSDTDTPSVSTVESDPDTTLATPSSLTSKSITATSPSKPSTISAETFLTVSKTVVSTNADIVSLDSNTPSVSTVEPDPDTTTSISSSTLPHEGITTVAKSGALTAVNTTSVLKTDSVSSVGIDTPNTLRLSPTTVQKTMMSDAAPENALPIDISTASPTRAVNAFSTSKAQTMNTSESPASVDCSQMTKPSSDDNELVHSSTEKFSQENCSASSCTGTALEKTHTTQTPMIKPTESIVTSCSVVSTSGTITTTTAAQSTPALNSSFSPSSISTASSSSPIVTLVTSSITTSVSTPATAIKQATDESIMPTVETPKLSSNNLSSQIENLPPPPPVPSFSSLSSSSSSSSSNIKTESIVACSIEDCSSGLTVDCSAGVSCCSSELENPDARQLEKDSHDLAIASSSKDTEITTEKNEEEKVLEAPDASAQSQASSLGSHGDVKLETDAEDCCSNSSKCGTGSDVDDSLSQLCETKSSCSAGCVTDSALEGSCSKEAETNICDEKPSTSLEDGSCPLTNLMCESDSGVGREDEPESVSDCNLIKTDGCEKEPGFNDVECKEIVNSSSGDCLTIDGNNKSLTCKEPPQSCKDEDEEGEQKKEVAHCSKEDLNESVVIDKYYSSSVVDNKEVKDERVSLLTSQIPNDDSDEQWPNVIASELSSDVEEEESLIGGDCLDKEEKLHPNQLRRSRGRPRKTNAELLLSSVTSGEKLLNPGNIINFRLRKDRPTLKSTKCSYCCCKKRCQISCVQNKCKNCIAESTSSLCRCNLSESQLSSMQKVALSNSTMCLNCHNKNKRASRGNKRKRSPSPKPIRHRSSFHSPLRSSSVSNRKTPGNSRLQKISKVSSFKKNLSSSPRKSLIGSPRKSLVGSPRKSLVGSRHKKSLTSSSHKKMTGVNFNRLSSEYQHRKQLKLSSDDKNPTEDPPKGSPTSVIKTESSPDTPENPKSLSNLATRRTLRSRKSLDETPPVLRQLRRSKSEQKLDSCAGDISKKQSNLLLVDNANGTLTSPKFSQKLGIENKMAVPLSSNHAGVESCNSENLDKKFVDNSALKELRQRVKLGPFKWDLEESETGGRAHSLMDGNEDSLIRTPSASSNLKESSSSHSSSHPISHSSMPSSPSASLPPFSSTSSSPSATADDELLGTGVTPPIRTYSRTQSPPSRIRVGRTYSKASDYQALPPGVMPIIDCLRPTSHSSASHLCDMPRVHVVRVDKKGNMFETRESYPLPRNPLDLDINRTAVDDEKGAGHRWKLQRTKMKTDGYPFSFKKARIQ